MCQADTPGRLFWGRFAAQREQAPSPQVLSALSALLPFSLLAF